MTVEAEKLDRKQSFIYYNPGGHGKPLENMKQNRQKVEAMRGNC